VAIERLQLSVRACSGNSILRAGNKLLLMGYTISRPLSIQAGAFYLPMGLLYKVNDEDFTFIPYGWKYHLFHPQPSSTILVRF
jgi:hypothetical protein